MCTAVTYKTKDFYFGRTLDYEFSYGEEITVTPRNYIFDFRHIGQLKSHYAIIGMAFVLEGYPLYYDAVNEKGLASLTVEHWLNIQGMNSNCAISFSPHTDALYAALPTKLSPAIPRPFSLTAS